MDKASQSLVEIENKENTKPLPSNSSSKNRHNVYAKSKSTLAHASSHPKRLNYDNDDFHVEHIGGVLAALSIQHASHDKVNMNNTDNETNQSDSESTLSLQSSYYKSCSPSPSQKKQNVKRIKEPMHSTTTKLFPITDESNNERHSNSKTSLKKSDNTKNKDSFASPKPPTSQVSYLRQSNQFQLTSPLDFGQSPITFQRNKSKKNPKFSSPLSYTSSSCNAYFPPSTSHSSATSTNAEESEVNQSKNDESSIDIPVYKQGAKKSAFNVCSDDDSYKESEDSEASYEDETSEDGENYSQASYIVQEPYIPYGKSLTQLDSAAKVFVEEEIIGSDSEDNSVDTDYSDDLSNVHDTETEDDVSSNGSRLKDQGAEATSVCAIALSHDNSVDSQTHVTVDAKVVETELKTLIHSDRSISVNTEDDDEEGYSVDADHDNSDDDSTEGGAVSVFSAKKEHSCNYKGTGITSRQSSLESGTRLKQISVVKRGQWALGSRIGEGSFGVVYVGMNNLTGNLMAVKKLNIPTSSLNEAMIDLQREIELMQSFNHQNIVRYIGSEIDRVKRELYIFQEVGFHFIRPLCFYFGSN